LVMQASVDEHGQLEIDHSEDSDSRLLNL